MNKYVFRFTLTDPLAASLTVKDPKGWDTMSLLLSRDKELHGVLENLNTALSFYHEAIDFINNVKSMGVDSEMKLLIELSSDFGVTWENFHNGLMSVPDCVTIENPTPYLTQSNITLDSVWERFYNRKDAQVNVASALDLDGNAVGAPTLLTIPMLPQVIRKQCSTKMYDSTDPNFVDLVFVIQRVTSGESIPAIDLPISVFNEVDTKYNYPPSSIPVSQDDVKLFPIIESVDTATEYEINFSIVLCNDNAYKTKLPSTQFITFHFWRDGLGPIAMTRTDFGTDGVDGRTVFTYTTNLLNIVKGTGFQITCSMSLVPTVTAYTAPYDFYPQKSFLTVLAHTTYPQTSSAAIRLKDEADAIIRRVTGGNNFHSDFLSAAGCGYRYANMTGLHLRGYSFADKPLSTSFSEFFKNGAAIFNWGVGYEKVGGVNKIVLESKSFFYDASSNSIDLSYVNNVKRSFKTDTTSNGIVIGYRKWQLTSGGSLIDDPQTEHTYSVPLRYVGQAINVICGWVAASLLFELTRRAVVKPGATFDTDNDTFILKLDGSDQPDLSYTAAANIQDPATRYNKPLTPGRNFLRWIKTFNVGLKEKAGGLYQFVNGLGNFLADITVSVDTCSGTDVGRVVENANVVITNVADHGIDKIEFEHELNWEQYKLIRDAKVKSIGVSSSGSNHIPYFIESVEFFLSHRKAKFTLFRTV